MRTRGLIAGIAIALASLFIARDYYWRLLGCMGIVRISNPYPGYCGHPSLLSFFYYYVVIFTVAILVGVGLIFRSIHYQSK